MASALFSFIDSIGETFEGVVENVETVVGNVEKEVDSAVQQIDAGVDLDDVLEEIELAGTDETAFLAACKRLEGLAQSQTATILHGWVVEDRVVPVVCAALCRVESAKLAAGPLARTLNGMGQALDSTGTTPEELRAFHEQIVRRTENGKAMMKLLQAQGVASRTQGLALLRRVYPETSSVLGRHLLSDPESISALMQILQDAKNNTTEVEEVALCAECVQFLRLVTAKDSDVRMIVTFQDGVEALLAIAAHALSAGSSAGPASVTFLSLATDACVCVLQLVGQGPVAQKYMREAGHLLALIRSLRAVVMAAGLTEAGGASWALGVRNVATVLLEAVGSFVSTAGIEAEQNSKALVQSTGFVELVCEVLQYHFDPLRLQAVQILTGAVRAAPEPSLGFFNANIQGGSMLDFFVATVLGKMSTPLEVRAAIEVLLAAGLERSADVRKALVSALEAAQLEESPGASGAGMFLLAFRMADQRIQGATQNACGSLDANTWFAARLLGQCIRSDVELRQQLTRQLVGTRPKSSIPLDY
ncbi:unnamed protein product [Durusdinium trenchii]|uniref:Uncharacterized protein n=1 Tax=Durusdinium trenchii TaxID=1381693 RepID=A0ABP0P7U2_9DINO